MDWDSVNATNALAKQYRAEKKARKSERKAHEGEADYESADAKAARRAEDKASRKAYLQSVRDTKKQYAASRGPVLALFEGYSLYRAEIAAPGVVGSSIKLATDTTASVSSGHEKSRMTATRIGAGALVAGPLGAVAGGVLRKHTTTDGYLSIEGSTGSMVIQFEAKLEAKARSFAAAVNSAVARLA